MPILSLNQRHVGSDKEKILLFHGGAAFDEFDATYWGQGEGSATTRVLAGGGRISTATNMLQALGYCMYALERGCPAGLHLIVVDKDLIRGEGGTEIMLDYADASDFEHHESVEVTAADILRIYESDPYAESHSHVRGYHPERHKAAKDKARKLMGRLGVWTEGDYERRIHAIMDMVFPLEDYEPEQIPNYEDIQHAWYEGVRKLLDSLHYGNLSIENVSSILTVALYDIQQSLKRGKLQAEKDGDEELVEELEWMIEECNDAAFAKERYFGAMSYVFAMLANSADMTGVAFVFCVMEKFAEAMRRNASLIDQGVQNEPWAKKEMSPEDPLDLKILVPSAVASSFDPNWKRKLNLTTAGHALSHPQEYFLFPDAADPRLRCSYWSTADMNRSLITTAIQSQARRFFESLSTF